MSLLMRASTLTKKPVVTLDGEDVAQVKDVLYEGSGGSVIGFTLSGRGLFAGPLDVALPWSHVVGCGRDAVIITDEKALQEPQDLVERHRIGDRNVLGARLVTDTGVDLGAVVDVIVETADVADVVGYEVEASAALGGDSRKVLIPLPDALSVSGEAVMVPAAALDFVSDDLAGFGAAVDDFRASLRGEN
jgi:sporulation protein YlmC with PRC-barrel domain